jgi:hypothetical protein
VLKRLNITKSKFADLVKGGVPLLLLVICLTGCTKLEQSTLGGDLIPAVDNVNTFAMDLKVVANNFIPADSTRIRQSDDHMAGAISNDAVFGTSKATIFFQMKPLFYPFKFNFNDSIQYFDSAVLVLRFRGFYGDSVLPVQFNLYETDRIIHQDTSIIPYYNLQNQIGINRSRLLGQKTISANQFRDPINIKRGDTTIRTVTNEIRIPLNSAFANSIFRGDSATVNGSDSIFNQFFKGFALEAQGSAQTLMYFSLSDAGSGIQFFYRAKKGPIQDTLETRLGTTFRSGHAVRFERNRGGAEVSNFLTPDPETGATQVYIQSAPGTNVSIRVPGLDTLSNKVLHRAELRMVDITTGNGPLEAPTALYLDAESKTQPGVYKGIPYDLSPFSPYFCYPTAGIDFDYFGGIARPGTIAGNIVNVYTFNITRYLQSVISRGEPSFNFRLSAPYLLFYKECSSPDLSFGVQSFPFQAGNIFLVPPGRGQIKLGGGNHPDPKYRMQLRIIYSTK